MRLRENPQNSPHCSSLGPGVPSLLSFLLLFFRALYLFYMQCLGFLLYSVGKETITSIWSSFPAALAACSFYTPVSSSVRHGEHLPHGVVHKIKQEHLKCARFIVDTEILDCFSWNETATSLLIFPVYFTRLPLNLLVPGRLNIHHSCSLNNNKTVPDFSPWGWRFCSVQKSDVLNKAPSL